MVRFIVWQAPDFSLEKYYDKLVEIHNTIEQTGHLAVNAHRFYVEAIKSS